MVYVGDSVKQKTDPKWRKGIFLGKVPTNDMYLTSVAGVLKLTRSIKALFPKWEEHMEEYRQVLVFLWRLEGTIGNRISPTLRGATGIGAVAVPALADEMGEDQLDDVEEDVVPQTPIPDFVPLQSRGGMAPPSAVVSDADGARPEGPVQDLRRAVTCINQKSLNVLKRRGCLPLVLAFLVL